MKKLKDSKGAATLFVLIAGLFFISFILSVLMLASAKRQSQIQIGKHTQDIYNELNQDKINQVKNVVPIYTVGQLLKIGSGEEIVIEEENGRRYVFSQDAYYILNNNIELEYNGIWDISQYNIDEAGYKIKIKDTSKPDVAYYYYVDKYDYPVTENGFKYENLILHFDGTNNTGNGHSDGAAVWQDLSGNGNNGTLTNFSYNTASGWKSDALQFDGSDDGVSIGDSLQDLFKNGNTIEMKIKVNELDARDIFIGNYDTNNKDICVNYEKKVDNSLRQYIGAGAMDVATNPLITSTERDYTISYVFDKTNGNLFVYIDGELKYSIDNEMINSYNYNWTNAWIGRDTRTGATCLNGEIYSVRIYESLLTELEVKNNYEAEKQKSQKEIVKYSKDQIVLDIDTSYASINGNTITDTTSGEQYTLQNGSWNSDKSMKFNGTTYMQCGHGGEFDGANQISIASTFMLESFEYDVWAVEQHLISTTESRWLCVNDKR